MLIRYLKAMSSLCQISCHACIQKLKCILFVHAAVMKKFFPGGSGTGPALVTELLAVNAVFCEYSVSLISAGYQRTQCKVC